MPLLLIHGLAEFRDIVGRIPAVGIDDVLPIALRGVDLQRRIVLPLVGIADLHRKGGQLLLRLGLGGVRHPVERRDVLAERRLQVLHQRQHALLVLGGEVFGDVHLADSLRQRAVGHRHRALPAGFHLLLARHHLAVEVERRLLEVVAQVGCRSVDILRREVVADILQRGVFQQVVGVGDGRRRGDDDRLEVADAHSLIVGLPVYGVVNLLEIGLRRGVVLRGNVAQLDVRPRLLGQLHLDVHHAGDRLFDVGFGNARKTEYPAQILLVALADMLVLRIEVVVAVAHRQPRLRDIEGVDVAVHQIGLHAHAEERIGYRRVEFGHDAGQLSAVLDGEDLPDGALQRRGALGVQTRRIETHLVEVRNLLLDASRRGADLGHLREKLVDALLVVVAQHVERAVTRIFGLQRVVLLPAARGVLVKIGVGSHRKVEIGHVDSRRLGCILTTCHTSYCCCKNENLFHRFGFLVTTGVSVLAGAPLSVRISFGSPAYLRMAATPGSSLPSMYSSRAPPPVET